MLKWIARNKYKLMAFILVAGITVDSYLHKGLVRVMFPKKYPEFRNEALSGDKHHLINKNKSWVKGVNTIERMNDKLDRNTGGMECDIYFNTTKNVFDVHHDADKPTGLELETLLKEYQHLGLQASIWLDFKNLSEQTAQPALNKLLQLREEYHLQDKLLVESSRAELLKGFGDSGFYTSYYTPVFNPYLINDDSLKYWVDSISNVVRKASVDAVSGYYFQSSFLHKYFPQHDVLVWAPNDRFSVINWLYKKQIASSKGVYIVLYP